MSTVDEWLALLQQSGGVPQRQPPAAIAPAPLGWLSGFGLSAAASVPGLVGIGPKRAFGEDLGGRIENWRAEHPWGSVGAELAGLAVPYGGAFKLGSSALRAVPSTARWLAGVDTYAETAPIRAAMMRETAALVPFETGRVATAAMVGDEGSLKDVALASGLDLAVTPLVVGAFKSLGRMLPEVELTVNQQLGKVIDGFDPNRPSQELLRDAYAMRGTAPPEYKDLLDSVIASNEQKVRLEGASGKKIAEPFFKGDEETQKAFSALIRPDQSPSKRFARSPKYGYPDDASWQAVVQEVGLPEDWLSFVQFPRIVEEAGTKKSAPQLAQVLSKMVPAQDGWAITRAADEDMYVVAKKLPGNRWFFATTNEPERVIPKNFVQRQSDKLVKFAAAHQERFDEVLAEKVFASAPDSVLAASKAYEEAIPPRTGVVLRDKTVGEKALELAESAIPGLRDVAGKFIPRAQQVVEGVRQYVAPAMHQFRNSPLAEWTRNAAQNVYTNAEAKANKVLYGDQGLQPGQNIRQRLLSNTQVGGLQREIANLAEEDLGIVTTILHTPTPKKEIDEALAKLLPDQKARIASFIDKLRAAQESKWAEMSATRKYAGESEVLPLADRLIPHVWKGDWRQRVADVKGDTIFMGGGKTREEAVKVAKDYVKDQGGHILGKPFQQGREEDFVDAIRIARAQRRGPDYVLGKEPQLKTLKDRLGIQGSLGWQMPLTKHELNDIVSHDIQQGYKHIADLIVRKDLGKWVPEVIARYGTTVGSGLVNRLNSMAGIQGKFAGWQNRSMDRALGNILGNNSASKLVGGLNEFEAHWNLMGLNLGNTAINALTFLQTTTPKIALLKSLPASRWGEFFDIAPAIGSDGTPHGIVQMPSVVKLIGQGWKAITNPTAEQHALASRAVKERVLAPGFLEEFVGQKSLKAFQTRRALIGHNSVYEGLKQLSSWLPTKVEEFTRAHSFMIGEIIGRHAGFQGEQLYQFAKQFTFRTMYQYSTADRPRIFTGPLGSMAGLFKNWMLHNYADIVQYGGEAARGNVKPLLWAMTGYGALGGLGALPFYGLVDASQKIFSDKHLMETVYDAFGGVNIASDAAFYGLPSLLGVSMQAQAEGMFANPARDLNAMYSAAAVDRAAKIGKFLGYTWDQYLAGGSSPFVSDRTWDLAAYALGPRSLYKAMAQVEDGALKAISNGAPVMHGVSDSEYLRNIIGFTPLKIARSYEASDQIWRDQKARDKLTADLGEAYAQAMTRQDGRTMQHVIGQAIFRGLDLSNVLRSAQSRIVTEFQDQLMTGARRNPDAISKLGLFGLM
jgi:hypothetical protein